MKTFRTVLFWLHLISGTVAGIVVLIMSVTGVLLTYEKQMVAWADTRTFHAGPPTPGASRLPLETLVAKVREARPDVNPATIMLRADVDAPAAFGLGRDGNLYVNAYTGAILGTGSPELRNFFRGVTDWHRWLAMSGDNRATGRAITGASNLLFLILVSTGLYLWFPRIWNWRQFRNVLWFRRGLAAKARDFNWHNVIGIWSFVPLFIIVLSGVVMSYPWANNLVYRSVGEQPPAPNRGGPGAGGPGGGGPREGGPREGGGDRARPEGNGVRSEGGPREGGAREGGPREGREARGEGGRPGGGLSVDGLNVAWTRAEQQVAGWKTITLRVPASPSAPAVFTIDQGNAGQPQKRGTLTLDRRSGNVVRWETFADTSRGRQLRSWLRFAHTGEIYGLVGQTIAGLVSVGGAVLVYTGLFLALRRFLAWRKRRTDRVDAAAALDREEQSAA
jgi:uncharacterized iron-regulated membrane protein